MKYTFGFKNAEGKGSREIEAKDDNEFWGHVRTAEAVYGYTHTPNSAFCITETRPVSEPPKDPPVETNTSPGDGSLGFSREGKPNAEKKN